MMDDGGVSVIVFLWWVLVAVLVAAFVVYVVTRIQPAVSDPEILLNSFGDVAVVSDDVVTISGKITKPGSVFINGIKQETFEDYKFEYPVLLVNGRNEFRIVVLDRFDKVSERVLYLYYYPDADL